MINIAKIITGALATLFGGIGLSLLFICLMPKFLFAPMLKNIMRKG